ncbi:MAG: hypothetical protein OSA11_05440 [Candidatus Nanopelagicales bacterium]|nr:hypothetical protein [Candidatus Nanopelagicales bacterium]
MGICFVPLSLALAWMFFLPVGIIFIFSGFIYTVFANSTAQSLGWMSNGFQKEIGFVSWGIGAAGLVASGMGSDA